MKNLSKKAALVSCLAVLAQSAAAFPAMTAYAAEGSGKIFINEVCAKNTEYQAADGNYYDWIELYNASSEQIDLSGFGITDDQTKPFRFTFPQGTSIRGGGHLLVFCNSDEVSIPGQLSAAFGLSTDGENIVLSDRNGNMVDSVTFGAIAANQSYGRVTDGAAEYGFMGMTPGSANRSDTVTQKVVPAPVFSAASGYYTGDFSVTISAENGARIYYTVDSSTPTTSSTLYTSPVSVSASALPDGSAAQNPGQTNPGQMFPGGQDGGMWGGFGNVGAPGDENQWGNQGGDFGNGNWGGGFGNGNWGGDFGNGNQGGDIGNGNWGDIGNGNWGDFGNGNWGDFGNGNWGGFPGMYPTIIAGAPENKKDAFVLRAVAVDSEGRTSAVTTAVYFLGIQNTASYYQNMKVVSLVTDSDNLNNSQTGIYANPMQDGRDWERPATMQIFSGGKEELSQDVGIRIHGGYTRQFAQKSFNVYARADYGKSKVEYDLFSGALRSEATGKKIKKFDSFIIRNTGNDSEAARFRDKLNQKLVEDRNFLQQAMEPCIVFINGEYFGQYELTEKISEDYVNDHTGVSKKDVLIVKNPEHDGESNQEFNELSSWVKRTDFSSASNYQQLCSKVDIDSFIDYVSCQVYFGNKDWGKNNVALWKAANTDSSNPYADGRWRFLLFDTEYSVNLYGQIPASTDTFSSLIREGSFIGNLLSAALKNSEFKEKFVNAFMDIANYNFDTAKINALLSEYSETYRKPAVDTFAKFYAGKTESTYDQQISSIKEFYGARYSSITNSLKTTCGLTGSLASVTVRNDSSKGTVKVNTLTPDMSGGSYTGKYYTDFPVTLTAEAAEGHTFTGWKLSDGTVVKGTSAKITVNGDTTVTAVYDESGAGQGNQSQGIKGDVNRDGSVNAADLAAMVGYMLGNNNSVSAAGGDLNGDGRINIVDLVLLKNILLG